MASDQVATLLRVSHFAALAHQHQRRKSPSSPAYIQHPLDVARRISNVPSSLAGSLNDNHVTDILCAAMCHDILEDTEVSELELRKQVGDAVTEIVLECTDDKSLSKLERKQAQIDHASTLSDSAKHVKLADKLSNLNDLISIEGRPAGWSVSRIQEYFEWSKRVTDQCKHVNPGLGQQLDDLYERGTFVYQDGETYKCIP
ncbi:uncharacterized protein JCM15063_003619 [Sporobolomyces koalae]|uniref:uncharacterized protein n=1 Tax=Sporobolomyces koalae TaxID=500713 RepID=UPI00316CC231